MTHLSHFLLLLELQLKFLLLHLQCRVLETEFLYECFASSHLVFKVTSDPLRYDPSCSLG